MSVMVSVAVAQVGMTEVILVNPGVKVNGQYYCDVLLSQQMLSAIKRVAERCLFTKQYVAYGEIVKVIVENVVTCFLGTQCIVRLTKPQVYQAVKRLKDEQAYFAT